ncbi:MAG: fumarylacetoacetate hydrolase family protein [Rhizobiaceae bacterium]
MSHDRLCHLDAGRVELKVNGDVKQEGDLRQMIWKLPERISYLLECCELAAGGVILSGTPACIAAITRGDVMETNIEGLDTLTVMVS